jgi:hypothetical protein
MSPTAAPVPVWAFDEQQARLAFDVLVSTEGFPAQRDRARRLFHASFRRLV